MVLHGWVFWTQKSTVGYGEFDRKHVTVDLGSEKPIRGFAWNHGGVAGVTWPKAILIFVSSDKKTWHWQGDLVIRSNEVNGKPPAGKYAVHRYHAENFSTKGRWVCFQAINSPYAFVDEVEVYEGPAENMTRPIGGKTYTDTKSHHLETLIQSLLLSQLVDLRERSKGYGESVHGLVDVELKRCREQRAMRFPRWSRSAASFRWVQYMNPCCWRIVICFVRRYRVRCFGVTVAGQRYV